MASRPRHWFAPLDPSPAYTFFVSHVNENAEDVARLKSEITAYSGRGGRPEMTLFIDFHNWPIANLNTSVIREYLQRSSFMLAWISRECLTSTRGWVWLELAYAQLVEMSLNPRAHDPHLPYIVPVFRNVTLNDVERTPWLEYWSRKLVLPDPDPTIVDIAHKLVDFAEQERRRRNERCS